MKKFRLLLTIIFQVALLHFAVAQDSATENGNKLNVYYFHSTHRCASCLAIEKETKSLINQLDAADKEKIELHILNLDDEKNKELVDKYELWGSALLLVMPVENQDEKVVVLTQDGFSYARTQPAKFRGILKENIQNLMHN